MTTTQEYEYNQSYDYQWKNAQEKYNDWKTPAPVEDEAPAGAATILSKIENELIASGQAPSHEMTIEWLEKCADKFEDCSIRFAESRGFVPLDEKSLAHPDPVIMLPSSVDQEFVKLTAGE